MSRPPDSTSSDVSVFASSAGAVNGAQIGRRPQPDPVGVPRDVARAGRPGRAPTRCAGPSSPRRGRARAGTSTATRTRAPRRGGRCDGSCPGWPSAPTPEGRTRAGEGHPSRDSSLPLRNFASAIVAVVRWAHQRGLTARQRVAEWAVPGPATWSLRCSCHQTQGNGKTSRRITMSQPSAIHHVELKPMRSVWRRGCGRSWCQRRPRSSWAPAMWCSSTIRGYPGDRLAQPVACQT